MKHLLFAASAIVLASAAPAAAQVMAPAEFVATAGASDLYERQSSELVLATTRDPKVRDFATMMIAHHTKSTNDVKAAATADRVKVAPPKLMPAQAEMIAQLRNEQGAARDAAYIAQQKTAHNQALAVHQAYASGGTAPRLRSAAAAIVPVVQSHIDMLKTM